MDKLKILISAYAFHPKELTFMGPDRGILAWNLVDRLRRFYDIWVITHSKNSDDVLEALSAGALPKVNIHFISLPRCWRSLRKTSFDRRFCLFLWQRKAWKYARSLHREIHFDAVHHLTPEFDWIPSFVGAYLKIPFIWGPLGGGERIPRGLRGEYSVFERWKEKWRLFGRWFGRKHYARREGEKNAQSILVCNQETWMRFPRTDVRKIHFFPLSGVASNPIKPDPKKPRNQDTFRIISAGCLHKNNGFSLSIKAYAHFSDRFPESDFVIFGEGPEQKTLERLIGDHKLESRVRIHPWIERKALHERMQDSDVFLSSGFLDRSGFFTVLAMSAGLPVVCLDAGGPAMHVQEKWGIRVKPENPDQCVRDLVGALEKLCTKSALRKKMSQAAFKNLKEHYTWRELGKTLKRIYGEVLLQEEDVHFSRKGEERFFY